MNKILISAIVAFIVGFLSNRFFNSQPSINSKEPTVQCSDLNVAKSNLISISQNEYIEYTKIKDLKQKYEKADELLGKIMLLFLADVGFKVKKDVSVEQVVATPAAVSSSPNPTPVNNNLSETAVVPSVPQNNPGLVGKSSLIKSLQTEKQIRDELNKAIIENPKMEIAKGEAPTQRQARILEGRYTGTIKFLDGKRQNLSVTWDLIPDYSKSGLSGTFNLNIHGPGTDSESSGRGNIDNIVGLAEDKDGFLVSGCGDQCYLQLYYNVPSDQFFGNYYESAKGTSSKPQRSGLVELKK